MNDNPDLSIGLAEQAALIHGRVGAWHDYGYADPPSPDCKPIPPLGERSANAIYNGHQAVRDIDEMIRQLHQLRGQLQAELRQDEDLRAARIDAMLAERKARHPGKPDGEGQDAEGRPIAELIGAAAGQSCSYCQASPGVPCDPPAGYHAARFLGLLASRAESDTVADVATGSGGLESRIVREVTAVGDGQDYDRADCGCPKVPGQIRHQRGICTDPVVARLNWYADDGETGQS